MKRQFAVILLLISILSLSGCHKEPSTPNALLPSMPGEVAEDAIIGEITSTVPLSQWPEEDGQANFDILGAAYANTSDGLVAFIDNEWTLFEKREISEQLLTFKWTPAGVHFLFWGLTFSVASKYNISNIAVGNTRKGLI